MLAGPSILHYPGILSVVPLLGGGSLATRGETNVNMHVDVDGPTRPGTSGAGGAGGRRRVGVRAMLALVACCAAISWAWRVWWDQEHPLQAAALADQYAEEQELLERRNIRESLERHRDQFQIPVHE